MTRVLAVMCLVPSLAFAAAPPLPTVEVVRPVVRMVRDTTTYTGRIRPAVSTTIRARVTGEVLHVAAKPGAEVKKGETLFEFDARPFEAARKLADAKLAVAEASSRRANLEFQRLQRLWQAKAVSADEYDRAESAVAEARAKTAVAKAERDLATAASAKVVAPTAGTFAPAVRAGDAVRADETVLATVSDNRMLVVDFALDEDAAVAFHRCDVAEKAERRKVIVSWDDHRADAVIEPTAAVLDAKTNTLRLRAALTKPAGEVLIGRKVEVTMIVSEPREAILVPQTAVRAAIAHQRLFVVRKDNVVEERPCFVRRQSGGLVEVLRGFEKGERIVRTWPGDFRGGELVNPIEVPTEPREK